MKNRTLDELIRAAGESQLPDDIAASDPRVDGCLSMGRLDTLAATGLATTPTEARHLDECPLCTGRLRAFRHSVRYDVSSRTRSDDVVLRVLGGFAVAAAAMILATFHVPVHRTGAASIAAPGTELAATREEVPISVCQEPPLVETPGEQQAGQFVVMTEESCSAIAVYRECEMSCDCREWQLHHWDEEGRTVADLDPNDLLEIAVDTPGERRIGQLLVLASARRPDTLPGSSDAAAALLDCLNDVTVSSCVEGDAAAYASALRECLPASITLVERTFRGE